MLTHACNDVVCDVVSYVFDRVPSASVDGGCEAHRRHHQSGLALRGLQTYINIHKVHCTRHTVHNSTSSFFRIVNHHDLVLYLSICNKRNKAAVDSSSFLQVGASGCNKLPTMIANSTNHSNYQFDKSTLK